MTNTKSTQHALLASVMAMLLCFTMLLGTTFAWFTDSVTSSGNKIVAGTLDVKLLMKTTDNGEYEDISESTNPIFGESSIAQNNNAETLWEPGKTQIAYLAIENAGTLELKYQVALNVFNPEDGKDLYKVMEYAIVPDAEFGSVTADMLTEVQWNSVVEGAQTVSDESVSLAVDGVHYFALVIHMDEDADNNYMNGSVEFDITVLATQNTVESDAFDNQYDADASFDDVIFANGGTYVMEENRNEGIAISSGATVVIDGKGKEINSAVAGLINEGEVTVNQVVMNAGSASNYSNITSGADAKTTYNDVTLNAAGGGVGAADGAEVIFNSGSVEVNTTSTSGRYLFYAEGEGTVITINGGDFADFTKTSQNQKRAYIYAGEGTTVYVKGGTFGKASTRSGYTAGILGSGTIIITGGTFGFDPSSWVQDGYSTTKVGENWIVFKGEILVNNDDELATAIAEGKTEITLADGTYHMPATAKGKTLTFNGTHATIIEIVPAGQGEANGQLDYNLDSSTITFNGVTIKTNNQTYAGYARLKGTYNDCVFENCYCLNGTSEFTNCTFNVSGDQYNLWTWGAPTATFNNCTFNSDGKAVLLYGTVDTKLTMNDCVFNDNGGIADLKAAIEIGNDYNTSYELIVNNTTVNGYEINNKGINTGTTLWGNKNSMGTDKLNVVVDGVDVY